jgi:hypothetical protein
VNLFLKKDVTISRDKVNNAYILFYERSEWFDCDEDEKTDAEQTTQTEGNHINRALLFVLNFYFFQRRNAS